MIEEWSWLWFLLGASFGFATGMLVVFKITSKADYHLRQVLRELQNSANLNQSPSVPKKSRRDMWSPRLVKPDEEARG